jgi:hypothetical protein
MDTAHHFGRTRTQRGAMARGFLGAVALAAGLAGAIGLQLAGPQLQARSVALLGLAPADRVALPCPVDTASQPKAIHAPRAHAIANTYGVGVMPAI